MAGPAQQDRSDEMDRDSTIHVDHTPHAGRRLVPGETDLICGLFLLACALAAWWFGQGLKVGTAFRMGPGYAPMLLSWTIGAFGLALCVLGVIRKGPALERWRIRPLIFVLGAMMVFALTVEKAGLLISAGLAVALAGVASPTPRFREIAMLAVCLAAGACALFPIALQLPLKVLP
ncbi:MAG: hypothetical protein RIS35_936 [Pseudomonadota bacterium]|jgi:putative tricarboxylic transport membrane protein